MAPGLTTRPGGRPVRGTAVVYAGHTGYGWFLGMIIAFTAARLILVGAGVPRTRVRLFQQQPRQDAVTRPLTQ
jgi:hypothetical protein